MFDEFINQVQQAAQAANQYKDNPRISINKLPLRPVADEEEKRLVAIAKKDACRFFRTGLFVIAIMLVGVIFISVASKKFDGKIFALILLFGVLALALYICVIKTDSKVVTGTVVMKGIDSERFSNYSTAEVSHTEHQASRVDVIVDGTNEAICTVDLISGEYKKINNGDTALIVNVFLGNYVCLKKADNKSGEIK